MNKEETSSEEQSDKNLVTMKDLETLLNERNIGDVVQVVDNGFRSYILLDDSAGNRRWNEFNGKDSAFMLKSNEWFKQGQKLFRDGAMTPQETDQLREVLLAVGVMSSYFGWGEEETGHWMDNTIVTHAHRIYDRIKGSPSQLEDLEHNEEFVGYLNMVAIMVKAFTELVSGARESASAASEDATNNETSKTVIT